MKAKHSRYLFIGFLFTGLLSFIFLNIHGVSYELTPEITGQPLLEQADAKVTKFFIECVHSLIASHH